MDPRGERPVYSFVVYSEVAEEVLGLKYHIDNNGNGHKGAHRTQCVTFEFTYSNVFPVFGLCRRMSFEMDPCD